METQRIYDATASDFAKHLVGKTVAEIDSHTETITLSDGTKLSIVGAGDCCAWFDGAIKNINLSQNLITAVDTEYENPDNVDDYLFTIVIYSVDQEIASVEVTGNEGSGYYGSSIALIVNKPRTIESFLNN